MRRLDVEFYTPQNTQRSVSSWSTVIHQTLIKARIYAISNSTQQRSQIKCETWKSLDIRFDLGSIKRMKKRGSWIKVYGVPPADCLLYWFILNINLDRDRWAYYLTLVLCVGSGRLQGHCNNLKAYVIYQFYPQPSRLIYLFLEIIKHKNATFKSCTCYYVYKINKSNEFSHFVHFK